MRGNDKRCTLIKPYLSTAVAQHKSTGVPSKGNFCLGERRCVGRAGPWWDSSYTARNRSGASAIPSGTIQGFGKFHCLSIKYIDSQDKGPRNAPNSFTTPPTEPYCTNPLVGQSFKSQKKSRVDERYRGKSDRFTCAIIQ